MSTTLCALYNHKLIDGCFITNPEHIKFIQKIVKNFQCNFKICKKCRASLEYLYENKMKRCKQKSQEISDQFMTVSSILHTSDLSERNNSGQMTSIVNCYGSLYEQSNSSNRSTCQEGTLGPFPKEQKSNTKTSFQYSKESQNSTVNICIDLKIHLTVKNN